MGKQIPVFGVEMTGFGAKLPSRRLTNRQLIDQYEINSDPKWIYDHTGIKQRYFVGEGENVVTLGVAAGLQALRGAGISRPAEIDYLFVASSTADTYRPISGAHPGIQKGLWEKGYHATAGDDRNLACTGFVHALTAGYHRFNTDGIDSAVVIGTEALSKKIDWSDRGTAIVFGDGAGAVALQRTGSESGLHGWWQETDSRDEEILYANHGEYIYMDGPRVLKRAVGAMYKIGDLALQKAQENTGITREDINYVVPHQANTRIFYPAAEKLGFNKEQVISTIDKHGNTSTASIPLALRAAYRAGQIKKGNKLLLVSFGGGMTMMGMVLEV